MTAHHSKQSRTINMLDSIFKPARFMNGAASFTTPYSSGTPIGKGTAPQPIEGSYFRGATLALTVTVTFISNIRKWKY